MRMRRNGSIPHDNILTSCLQNRIGCPPYLLQLVITGDCHGIVSKNTPDFALRCCRHIGEHSLAVGESGPRIPRPRRRSGHRNQLHADRHGDHRLGNVGTGGRRRTDRRRAAALRRKAFSSEVRVKKTRQNKNLEPFPFRFHRNEKGSSRGARSSASGARSRCRSGDIPARRLRYNHAPHCCRENTVDRRHRVRARSAGRPVTGPAAVESRAARPQPEAMPAPIEFPSEFRMARFAPARLSPGISRQKQPILLSLQSASLRLPIPPAAAATVSDCRANVNCAWGPNR
jgi:hypothetical protein